MASEPPKSRPLSPRLARCIVCRSWWSVASWHHDGRGRDVTCGCGADLYVVDMDEHLKTLPLAQPSETPTKK